MPKESTNLKLKLYNVLTDAKEFALDWFNNIFDYSNSNWVKIDDAYKELKDNFDNYPLKDGTGATGDWDINAKSATNDSAGQQIDATYIKDLRPTGDKIIIIKGNNETTTIDGAAPKGYTLTETIPSPTVTGQTWFHVGSISNTSDGDLIKIEIDCPTTISTENTSIAYSRSITLFIHDLAQTDDSDLSTAYIFSYIVYDDKLKSSDVDIENGLATRNYFYLIPTSGGDGQSNAELWINTDSIFFNSIINVSLAKKDNWGYVLKYSANAPSVDQAITPYSKTSVVTDTNYATKTKAGIVQIGNNITVGDKGLISLIKDNIDGALGYEAAEKMSLVSVTIPATGWSQDDNSAYPNYIDITAADITTSDCVALVIAPDSNAVAKKCYFTSTEALAGKIRIRSRNIPTEAIKAFYYVIREDILMSFGQTPIGGEVDKLTAYPVGSIFQTVDNTSPAELFGGTWEQIASNRVLMGVDKGNTKPGTTVSAGLPNITGSLTESNEGQGPLRGMVNSWASSGALSYVTRASNYAGHSSWSASQDFDVYFDASKSNSIYGKSTTVQPAAYYVYIWRRVS